MPGSNDRPMDENRQFHVERFSPIAEILAASGISLGLEFIGPKTLRDTQKFPFVYKMGEMLEFGREIGSNVGLLLDAYHWYTSHATLADLGELKHEDIVYVHLNDARDGFEIDEQLDGIRRLPGETGVIDLHGFVRVLKRIGYDGPVAVEPFKKELGELGSDEERLRVVRESLDKVLAY
jgi:sugar phosphate isomerase/epimerase